MSVFPGFDPCRDGHYSRQRPSILRCPPKCGAAVAVGSHCRVSRPSRPRTPRRRSRPRAGIRSWRPPLVLVMTGITVTTDFPLAVIQHRLHAWLLAEPDQIARGRERQLEAPALAAFERLARRHPDRVGGFLAVMGADLCRRRRGEEEPGIEPLRHALGRDPVRVGHQFVERQHHAVVGQHLEEADLAVAEVGAMRRLDFAGASGIDQRLRALRPRQQDAALLESFADRGDTEAERDLVEPLAARIEFGCSR